MKRIFLSALAALLPFVVFYGLGAFVTMAPDAREWSEGGRLMYALVSVWAGSILAAFCYLKPEAQS